MTNKSLRFLDLFAGAGGLSEGFIRAGFSPVAHVEMSRAACYTLKTRIARHWLTSNKKEELYFNYLNGDITRETLYSHVSDNRFNSVINEEIEDKTLLSIFKKIDKLNENKKIDLIIGGPPCQAYSIIGRSRDSEKMKGDHRNYLYLYYSEFLRRYKPEYFIFENVLGLMSAKSENEYGYFSSMKSSFSKSGYEIEANILSANDYGVLQNRKRVIIFGKKKGNSKVFPVLDEWNPDVLVNEIFKDLPELNAGCGSVIPCKLKSYKGDYLFKSGIKNDTFPVTWHQTRPNSKQDLEIYRIAVKHWNKGQQRLSYSELPERLKTHNNTESFTDRFKVVAGNSKACHTVVAHIAKDGHYYIHPDIVQNRSLSVREAARLQTFPDDYFFESESGKPSRTAAFTQIGNAVPVLMAEKIAKGLLSII